MKSEASVGVREMRQSGAWAGVGHSSWVPFRYSAGVSARKGEGASGLGEAEREDGEKVFPGRVLWLFVFRRGGIHMTH